MAKFRLKMGDPMTPLPVAEFYNYLATDCEVTIEANIPVPLMQAINDHVELQKLMYSKSLVAIYGFGNAFSEKPICIQREVVKKKWWLFRATVTESVLDTNFPTGILIVYDSEESDTKSRHYTNVVDGVLYSIAFVNKRLVESDSDILLESMHGFGALLFGEDVIGINKPMTNSPIEK